MTIKVTSGDCCDLPKFESYSITLHVDNIGDHVALKYLSMCNSKVPDALYQKATDSFRGGKYREQAGSIRTRTKAFLLALCAAIPSRNFNGTICND